MILSYDNFETSYIFLSKFLDFSRLLIRISSTIKQYQLFSAPFQAEYKLAGVQSYVSGD